MRGSVLVVDDNHAFRETVRQLLARGGFVVIAEAENGREGIRQAAAHRPDIAIVDVQLPDIDGFEVAEEIGGLGLNLQVILTSSLDGADFGSLVTDSSAAGFVPKAELSAAAIEALLVPPADRAPSSPSQSISARLARSTVMTSIKRTTGRRLSASSLPTTPCSFARGSPAC